VKQHGQKIAASLMGVSLEEFLAHTAQGNYRCGSCREWLPRPCFYKDNRGSGIKPVCIECVSRKNRARYARRHGGAKQIRSTSSRQPCDYCGQKSSLLVEIMIDGERFSIHRGCVARVQALNAGNPLRDPIGEQI
jgi:hypothetical protein